MNSDLVEFYYKTKYASSISSREKEASEIEKDEKIANNFRQIASTFAKNHPKAVENAITGGILGAGSELVMPANKDMMGNPSTNLGEIAKRSLLGATLGGIGGEVKTQVRNHVLPKIAQEDTEKIAGKLDGLKQFGKNNAGTLIGAGALGSIGASAGYSEEKYNNKGNPIQRTKSDKLKGAIIGGLYGGVSGGLLGKSIDKLHNLGNTSRSIGKIRIKSSPIPKAKPDPITLPKDRGKVLDFPVGKALQRHAKNKSMAAKAHQLYKPEGQIIPFPTPEKTAGAMDLLRKIPSSITNNVAAKGIATAGQHLAPSSLLQTAGKYMAKSPTLGGAVIGGGAGLVGNTLSGEDHALGATLAGAGLGALGGKAMLKGNVSRSNPLFGQSFGTGVRNELKAGLKAKPVVSSPITSPSLQNAPKLDSLVAQSGTSNIGPSITPNKPVGPAIAPQRPQEIDWAKKQAPVR